ncbi:hypothetical protein GGI42DRAFT_230687 [Trichoderma sp. SZMC 28013]
MPSPNPPARHAVLSMSDSKLLRRTCVGGIANSLDLRPTSRRDSRACRWRRLSPPLLLQLCNTRLGILALDPESWSRPARLDSAAPRHPLVFALLAQAASAILFDYVVLSFFFRVFRIVHLAGIVSSFDGRAQSRPTKRHFRTSLRLTRKITDYTVL